MNRRKTPVGELFSRRFIKSGLFGFLKRNDFRNVRTYCMFIGYQRSGHSVLGALLDAHPNVVMGMEVDVLNLVRLGYSRSQIFYCLVRNSQLFRDRLNNVWTGYDYSVPGQFQGRYESLLMLGDKKGGKSTLRLGGDPVLFEDLKTTIGANIKVLHVVRNPYDNISTMVLRHAADSKRPTREEIMDKIDLYFRKVGINMDLLDSGRVDSLDIYQESFISNPREELEKILHFLGIPIPGGYIGACSRVVYREPHRSRYEINWPEDLKGMVAERMKDVGFLRCYSYDT